MYFFKHCVYLDAFQTISLKPWKESYKKGRAGKQIVKRQCAASCRVSALITVPYTKMLSKH